MPSKPPQIRVGIGGWTFEPWRGTFYPDGLAQKRELEYASSHLTSIEINGTYYGSQKPESFARWREETPDHFMFSVKGPRFATNRRVLAEGGQSIERFLASGVLELKEKLGPINWQFLPTKSFDAADFEEFLKLLPHERDGRALRHVVEVRHESFRVPEFVALLRRYRVAVVLTDKEGFPQIPDVTAPFVYARLQGASEKIKTGLRAEGPGPLGQPGAGMVRGQNPGRPRPRRRARQEGTEGPRRVRLHDQRIQAESTSRRHGVDRAAGVSGRLGLSRGAGLLPAARHATGAR